MKLRVIAAGILAAVVIAMPISAQGGMNGNGGCNMNGCCTQQNIDAFKARLAAQIEQVKVIVDKSGNAEAKKVLEEAIAHYTAAVALVAEKKLPEAWAEFKTAAKLVAKALALAGGNINGNNCMNIDEMIKSVGAQIEKAKPIVEKSGNAEAQKLLDQAIVSYNKAIELNTAGKKVEAMAELRNASALVCKAMALAGNCNGTMNCDKMFQTTAKTLEAAKVIVEKSGKPEAQKVLDEANAHYAKALELKAAGKMQEAMAELKLATELANKAITIATSH